MVPRRLFRGVMLGLEDRVKESITDIYSCLLCRMCEEYCPSGVHIAENIRYLRKYINEEVFKLL
jgi:heterodisulfide reductase subunit C